MHWRTKLIHPAAKAPEGFKSLSTPVHRGSTVVFDSVAEVVGDWRQEKHGYSYGTLGTPTVLELAARIAEIEGAHHTFLAPSGQAAIVLAYLACCTSGGHGLLPHNIYSPSREIAHGLLKGLGIEIESYDPKIGAGVADLIRPNTQLIWTESPGSLTMEIQDVPAIARAAKARGVLLAVDNTYAAGVLFDAFGHGADISVQAVTKYISGHSDVLMGSVSVANAALYERVGEVWNQLGMSVSPDEASLALRGLQTMGLRLEHLERATLDVAKWLTARKEIETVLHPALPSCPGHELWKRDFTGSASVFSFVFREGIGPEAVAAFVDRLKLFRIGYSWGGTASLVTIYPGLKRPGRDDGARLVRLNIGLEEPADLIADLEQALAGLDR